MLPPYKVDTIEALCMYYKGTNPVGVQLKVQQMKWWCLYRFPHTISRFGAQLHVPTAQPQRQLSPRS